jgi:hypothetical protein
MKNFLVQLVLIFLAGCSVCAQVPNILNYQGRIAVRGVNFDGNGQFKFALVDGGTTTTPATRTATGTAVINSGFVTSITLIDGGVGYTSEPTVTLTGGGGSGANATASLVDGAVTGFTITSPGFGYSSEPTVSVSQPPEPTATTNFVTYWSNDGSSVAGSEPVSSVNLPVSKGLFSIGLGDDSLANNQSIQKEVFEKPELRLRIWFNDGTKGWQRINPDAKISPAAKAHNSAVRLKTYTVPFNFYVSGSGTEGILSGAIVNLDGRSIILPLEVNGSGYGQSAYALHPVPPNCDSILSISASVEANNTGSVPNGPGGGKAGVRVWAKGLNAQKQLVAESVVDRVNGTAQINGPIILDKSQYQYFIEVVCETYWNNGFRGGRAKVNSVSLSYIGKETD